MKAILALFFLYVALVFSQQPPVLNDSFTAQVELIESTGTHTTRMNATLYIDLANKRERFDTQHNHEHPHNVEFLRLFSNHTEFEILDSQDCRERKFNREMHGTFDWVANATLDSNPCHARFNSTIGLVGQLWTRNDIHLEAYLCVSKDQSTPYWTEFTAKETNRFYRAVQFYSYKPGAPSPSVFSVPSSCP